MEIFVLDTFLAFLYNFFAFLLIISVIVFAHEFGHYYIARIFGVRIETFSIGFGHEILGWNDKHGTRWKISAIPAGGYVKMFGDTNPASVPDGEKLKKLTESEKKVAFHTKSLPIKSAVVAAGPIANFIFAIITLTVVYSFYGKPYTLAEISDVMQDSAAHRAGIKSGDIIVEIEDEVIESFEDITKAIAVNTGTPIVVVVDRNGEYISIEVTPDIVERESLFGDKIKTPMLGIMSGSVSHKDIGVMDAIEEAFKETFFICKATLEGIGQMITGARSTEELSGPIRIAKYSGSSLSNGLQTVLWFMVVLSVNLGLLNLFPIPLLDGGHLLYYAVEAVQGKPLADKIQEYGFKIGFALIISLAIFATFNDLKQLDIF